jgi:hypothetical protein
MIDRNRRGRQWGRRFRADQVSRRNDEQILRGLRRLAAGMPLRRFPEPRLLPCVQSAKLH